ncbi:Uncharacterized protein Fot_32519 [Forsythia ovata]|uniref:Uncharacterized protein n=1 Tax=Forsythia ovata TaxID=205694 RepID=A0ABD1T809_9LAMI
MGTRGLYRQEYEMDRVTHITQDNVNVKEALLEEEDEGPALTGAKTFDEEKIIPPECNLSYSDNVVDDDGFIYDTNALEHVAVGLNADPTIELEATGVVELGSDDGYCPSEEGLLTDYCSSEENNYHFFIYDAEKEKYDPQLEWDVLNPKWLFFLGNMNVNRKHLLGKSYDLVVGVTIMTVEHEWRPFFPNDDSQQHQ